MMARKRGPSKQNEEDKMKVNYKTALSQQIPEEHYYEPLKMLCRAIQTRRVQNRG